MKLRTEDGLTFDDVLLEPQYNEIRSRQDVSLNTRLCKGGPFIQGPLVSANMNSVTESDMMIALNGLGCVGVMHRFMTPVNATFHINRCRGKELPFVVASLGVNGDANELLKLYNQLGVDVICVDVAHGHSRAVKETIISIKELMPDTKVIAGNVATAEATEYLINAGADAIKVGIGPGSLCTTRIVTGCGVPQLTAIAECYAAASKFDIPIIADGGMRNSGDVVKALAAGAESVMSGSFFSGTDEAPGDIVEYREGTNLRKYKKYQGMASADAMTGWKGKGYHAAPEGEATLTPYKGPVEEVVKPILAGIRSGLTYNGAINLEKLRENAVFRKISPNCLIENRPHGK